ARPRVLTAGGGKNPGPRGGTGVAGSDFRPAPRERPGALRPADGRRAGGETVAVRPPGHRRGGVEDRGPGARRRHARPPLRPRHLGPEGGGPAAARAGRLARSRGLTLDAGAAGPHLLSYVSPCLAVQFRIEMTRV